MTGFYDHGETRYQCGACNFLGEFEDFNEVGQCPECGEVEDVHEVDWEIGPSDLRDF